MKLENKTVLITGASSGIGRSVAEQLAAKGNRVVVTARRQALLDALAEQINSAGGECLAIASDALNEGDAQRVVDETVAAFGQIDAALMNIGDGPSFNMA